MKPRLLLIAACVLSSHLMTPLTCAAGEQVIDIWPEGVPGLKPDATPEKDEGEGRVGNIHHPTLTYFAAPAAIANGTAVIICPGGGYSRLSFGHEGIDPARWFNSLGVTAFVLKYRVKEYGHPAPLRDALRAVRWVRSRAAEFGVRTDRIGMMGFSAGGHLAASAGTLYDAPEGRTGAALDSVSGRPDFLLLIYPVITMQDPYVHAGSRLCLIGPHPTQSLMDHLSPELQVTKDTPPAFLVSTEEDKTVPFQNSVLFFEALKRAGVPAEIHVFEKGPHGFGMRKDLGATSEWPLRCADWLRLHNLLPKPAA
jgi:acetyl esterase/lipase